ncbi:MAG: M67 family metallopeptidase [Sulfuricaulis sp.]
MNTICLPRPLVNQLLQLAQKSPDEEICGLISRDSRGFRTCYPVPNLADDKKRFFALDPKAQIDAMRAMREHGEELAAIFHSHPHSPPFPSPIDVKQHEYPDVLYLIISLAVLSEPEMRGFHIRGHAIEEVAIGLQEGPAP